MISFVCCFSFPFPPDGSFGAAPADCGKIKKINHDDFVLQEAIDGCGVLESSTTEQQVGGQQTSVVFLHGVLDIRLMF